MVENRRVLFKGPAGTGKTFLAIEAARRAIREGRSTAIVCFNSLLSNWIRSETQLIQTEAKRRNLEFYAGSLSALMLNTARVRVPENADRDFWWGELPNRTIEALLSSERASPSFDFLVIDEAQDLLSDESLDILDLLLTGGLSGGRWAIFGDFERQAIYADVGAADGVERLTHRAGENFTTLRLRVNCRNSARIAEAVTITSGLSPGYSRVLNESASPDVEPMFYRNTVHQSEILKEILGDLLKVFSSNQIVVLSTRTDTASCASGLAEVDIGVPVVPFKEIGESVSAVRYASIHSFKGLEASAVIITDVEHIDDEQSKALLYVGMSRARVRLHILMNENLRATYDAMLDHGLRMALQKGI